MNGQNLYAASIGIIGGADGPTSVFVTGPDWPQAVIGILAVAALLAAGIFLLKKSKR